MAYSSIIVPKVGEISVSHQHALGVVNYDLDELYSPDTAYWKSKVLDLVSPKYSPNATYIFDKSRYRNHGTITGATWKRLPSGLWYLDFDGTDDFTRMANAASLNFGTGDFSLMAWINCATGGANQVILLKMLDGDPWDGYALRVKDTTGYLSLLAPTGGNQIIGDIDVGDEVWHLAGGTFEAGVANTGMKLYVDGVEDVSARASAGAGDKDNTNYLYIGIAQDGLASDFTGGIALPRVFNRVLTATEILNMYNQEKHLFGV